MRRSLLIFIISLLGDFFISSCNFSNQNPIENTNKPKLYVILSSTKEINKELFTNDSNYTVETNYFEIGLYSVGHGKSYTAEKEIRSSISQEGFSEVRLLIVDSLQKQIYFNNSTEFLNFMSDRGYEMQDQEILKYQTNYTFKRIKD